MTAGGFPSPQLAVIGPGGGKTNLLRFLAAQQLRHLWPVDFVDLGDQHGWADGLPGVSRWRTVEETEAGLVSLHDEFRHRERGARQAQPRLLLVDDIDVLLPQLEDRWSNRRRPGQPTMGPAVSAWAEIWLRGRRLAIHAIVASRPDKAFWADVAGTRIIGAGVPRSTWDAVAPEVEPPPAAGQPHPGRVYVLNADGDDPTETQVVWITGPQARKLATGSFPTE
jgi:hypothetical protein